MLEPVAARAPIKVLFGHDKPKAAAAIDDWTTQSDHGAFHAAGIPFVYFGVEDHPDYHKPTDTADKIDATFFCQVAATILDAVTALDRALPSVAACLVYACGSPRGDTPMRASISRPPRRAVPAVQRRAVGVRSDPDRPPLRRGRTIGGRRRSAPPALAFGRVQSVLNSIEGLLEVMGPSPAAYVRAFEPARDRRTLDHLVHRWTRGVDLAALVWMLRQMLDSHGSIEAFFVDGADPAAETIEARARRVLAPRVRARSARRSTAAVVAEAGRRLLLFAAVERRRLQAAQPVPALDGAARRRRSRRLVAACGRRS